MQNCWLPYWVTIIGYILSQDTQIKFTRHRRESRTFEVDSTTNREVESSSYPISCVQFTSCFFPHSHSIKLNVILDIQRECVSSPSIDLRTKVIIHGNHSFHLSLVIPSPVHLHWHANGKDAFAIYRRRTISNIEHDNSLCIIDYTA